MDYIIGIDSGGTKTQANVYDLQGVLQEQVTTGYGNLLIDYEQGTANLKAALKQILTTRAASMCKLVVIGLAGIDGSGLKEAVLEELAIFKLPLQVINDGQLAHYALLKGQSGLLVIAGTGSVCIGKKNNQWARTGGWGHVFGDEGSAYYIGKRAIQQVFWEADCGNNLSEISQAVLTHMETSNALELCQKSYQLSKGEVAELATIVANCASSSKLAAKLLAEAGEQLAQTVIKLARRLYEPNACVPVGLNGSVIEKNEWVRMAFFQTLQQDAHTFTFFEKEASSAKGAYYFYKTNGAK